MEHVIVQISPKRWIIAEKSTTSDTFVRITKPINSRTSAQSILTQLQHDDTHDYSQFTKDHIEDDLL